MFDGERGESIDRREAGVLPVVSRRGSKLSSMGEFFIPQAEVSFWPRKRKIEARVPGIRVDVDPARLQPRREEKLRRENELKVARERARQRVEELRAGMRSAMEQMDREREKQMEHLRNVAVAGGTLIGGMVAFGVIAGIYLEFQSIVASIPSVLSGLGAFAETALVASSEALRALLAVLAAGDFTMTAAVALVTLSLSFAAIKATLSGIEVRKQRTSFRR